jgi:hypothetical protein
MSKAGWSPAEVATKGRRVTGNDRNEEGNRLWSFPDGMLGPDDSIKDYEVEASDGHVGKVSWASYAPGESYLVVSLRRHLHETHHVIPAAAVETVSAPAKSVRLCLTRADVERAPEQHDSAAPLDASTVDFLAGLWPTWLDSRRT